MFNSKQTLRSGITLLTFFHVKKLSLLFEHQLTFFRFMFILKTYSN